MASHAIFQYNVLAIDDTHNTWTNMIVKMTILRLLLLMLFVASGYEAFRCLMTKGEKCTLKASKFYSK